MILRITGYLMLALFVSTSYTAYACRNIVRCVFIGSSDFEEIEDNLYVSGYIPSSEHQSIRAMIDSARLRIKEHFGKPIAKPVIIVTGSEKEAEDYGLQDTPGSLFFTPWTRYLILSHHKGGLDVASHELVHAEIVERLGYFIRQREIPTWFDEGVSLQVDFRPHYMIDLDLFDKSEIRRAYTLDSPDKFWTKNRQQNIRNYLAAKAAVTMFFRSSTTKALYPMLSKIREGKRFEDLFNESN